MIRLRAQHFRRFSWYTAVRPRIPQLALQDHWRSLYMGNPLRREKVDLCTNSPWSLVRYLGRAGSESAKAPTFVCDPRPSRPTGPQRSRSSSFRLGCSCLGFGSRESRQGKIAVQGNRSVQRSPASGLKQ